VIITVLITVLVLALGGGAAVFYVLNSRSKAVADGTYQIGRQLSSRPDWSLMLTTVEVSGGQMTVNVVYQNLSAQPAELECPTQTGNFILAGGEHLSELDSYCYYHIGQFTMQAGEQLMTWGTYPKPKDSSSPFVLHWYNWGDFEVALP
jgi:hypothetical protein